MPPIALELIGTLPVAAASGLVAAGPYLYIIGDDETHLTVLRANGSQCVARVPLFPDELPQDAEERKLRKPDLEAVALLPGNRILALGSGSLPSRCRGAIVPLLDPGWGPSLTDPNAATVTAPAQIVELSPLYEALGAQLPELNIEGAAVIGDRLRLLQRDNGGAGQNAVIDLDLDGLLRQTAEGLPLGADLILAIRPVALGRLDGVRLSFTDASPLPDGRLVFTAAAEDTCDTYTDGPCVGSAVGVLSPGAVITYLERLDTHHKIEGVHARSVRGRIDLLLVADADNPAIPSPLLAASIARA